ncbi:hypothetical protein FF32_13190 [Halomonas campaniensis]|nr:hypothetical protein FF32_13190 [Halomonas campaniensis]
MARPKSLLKNIYISEAKRQHSCKSSASHKIQKGDKRLSVKEGQNERNYCMGCGKKFLDSAIEELSKIRSDNWEE